MRYFQTITPVAAFLFLFTASAFAQKAPPRFEVFAEGGGSFLNGGSVSPAAVVACPVISCPTSSSTESSSFSKTGRLYAGARLRFRRHDALEASYSFSPNHLTLHVVDPGSSVSAYSGSSYDRLNFVSFNYVHYLWVRSPIQPFATGGIGFNRFGGPVTASAVTEGLMGNSHDMQFAWNFGAGTDLVLQRHLALRLELRDYLTGQPATIKGLNHDVVPSAGLVFRFK